MINSIIETMRECAIQISHLLKDTSTQYLESSNTSGDMQLEVDVLADQLIEKSLLELRCVKGVCSEEKPVAVYNDYPDAPYIVAYDPLDGSSLVDSDLTIGTIFGIYDNELKAPALIASGYILYGPRLEMVVAQTQVLHYRYNGTLWRNLGALQLNHKGKINAPGGTQKHWEHRHKTLIDSFFAEGYRLRYSGGMVPDLHQILIKSGGLFSYPATSDAPKGKLRKLFEVFPLAFIYEKAGGEAIDGKKRILELDIDGIHDTTPCFLGSPSEIERVRKVYE